MPIGINNKRHNDGSLKYDIYGKPYQVQLVQADYSRRYAPEDIAAAFGFTIVVPQKPIIQIDEDEFKFDAIWLKLADYILSKAKMGDRKSVV